MEKTRENARLEAQGMDVDELNFAVFCVENIAEHLNLNGSEVYRLLSEDSDILDGYVIPNYDALHTQDKEYIVNDIIEYMCEKGLIK
ncbi:MAG: DUF3791 domain-containing protein [Synergistaceae bacterium]|nr:DUF3791 domain-containing protein [Synergistaceae bacterium]